MSNTQIQKLPLDYFLEFFPFRLWGDETFQSMAAAYLVMVDKHAVHFFQGKFLLFIGFILRMTMFGLPVEKYWNWADLAKVEFQLC